MNKNASANNITWHDTQLTQQDREKRNGHRAAIIWLTGLPSSGKSTTAVGLQLALFKRGCQVFALDGDNVRHGLNKNLGFSHEDRTENIRRVGEVAKLFTEAGFLVITSFISPYRQDRDSVRALLPKGAFLEVYINTTVEVCEKRDPKGLYQKARKQQIKDFTGISAPYEKPEHPEIIVDTEKHSPEDCVQLIVGYLEKNGYIPKRSRP